MDVVDLWPMGGPSVVVWCAAAPNFRRLSSFPGILQFITMPSLLLARFIDKVFFKDNVNSTHPDTAGWVLIAQAPK